EARHKGTGCSEPLDLTLLVLRDIDVAVRGRSDRIRTVRGLPAREELPIRAELHNLTVADARHVRVACSVHGYPVRRVDVVGVVARDRAPAELRGRSGRAGEVVRVDPIREEVDREHACGAYGEPRAAVCIDVPVRQICAIGGELHYPRSSRRVPYVTVRHVQSSDV